jgi:hypothetical protein
MAREALLERTEPDHELGDDVSLVLATDARATHEDLLRRKASPSPCCTLTRNLNPIPWPDRNRYAVALALDVDVDSGLNYRHPDHADTLVSRRANDRTAGR